jgi:hypothetical protein
VSPARKRDSLEYRFDVANKGKVVRAYYTGIVPDTFKAESEVVLKGRLAPTGHSRRQGRRDGQVPVEVRPGESCRCDDRCGAALDRHEVRSMASLGSYLLLTAFVICAYAASISIRGGAPPFAPPD